MARLEKPLAGFHQRLGQVTVECKGAVSGAAIFGLPQASRASIT